MADILQHADIFIKKNAKKLQIILIALILITAGIYFYINNYKKPKEAKAFAAFAFAEGYLKQSDYDKALNGDGKNIGFLKIIDKYSGTKAANLSYYYAGACMIKMQQPKKAIDFLEKANFNDALAQSRVLALLGDAYGDTNNIDKAFANYKDAAKMAEDDKEWASENLFKAAFIIESKTQEKAIEIYTQLIKEYPNTYYGTQAVKYLAKLGKTEIQ